MGVSGVILFALVLPWLGGTLLLAVAQGRLGAGPFPLAARLGYGFFLGELLLVLQIRVVDALGGGLGLYWNIAPSAMLVLLCVGLLWRGGMRAGAPWSLRGWDDRAASATLVLLLLIAVHLMLISTEVVWRPLFPWDAWTTWTVRAKVWAGQGALVPFVSPADWLASDDPDRFTIFAYGYPAFTSVLQAWGAVVHGGWSERLINLPWIGALVALLLALFGQARACGFSATGALLLATLLLAMPIVHTHAALAGYADLWLAGFTGLGLVALLMWRLRGDRLQLLLALVMLVGGVLVKREGAVWLLVALALPLLSWLGWRSLWLLLPAVALAVPCWDGGCSVGLPGLGTIGIDGGGLLLGALGRYSFELHDATGAFVRAFFSHATWGLFWYALLLSLPILFMRPFGEEKRLLAILSSLFGGAMVAIFFLSAEGAWAMNFTSINRLPLHFAPALLFALACAWRAHWRGGIVPTQGGAG